MPSFLHGFSNSPLPLSLSKFVRPQKCFRSVAQTLQFIVDCCTEKRWLLFDGLRLSDPRPQCLLQNDRGLIRQCKATWVRMTLTLFNTTITMEPRALEVSLQKQSSKLSISLPDRLLLVSGPDVVSLSLDVIINTNSCYPRSNHRII